MPQNLSHFNKNNFILVDGEKIYLNQYSEKGLNLDYLLEILKYKRISFKDRKHKAKKC